MSLSSSRIRMSPQVLAPSSSAWDVGMLGHCPGGCDVKQLLQSPSMVAQIEALGCHQQLAELRLPGLPVRPVYGLPIPIESPVQFDTLFPLAGSINTRYGSRLAGRSSWLRQAVADFFYRENNQQNQRGKLWIICVDEAREQQAFLPADSDDWLSVESATAFSRALMIPSLACILLPDLERLQVPAQLQDVPRLRLANPVPEFLPCSANVDDDHRERRSRSELGQQAEPLDFSELLAPMLRVLQQRRPDVHLLLSLPFEPEQEAEQIQVSSAALNDLETLKSSQVQRALSQTQLLYPYLKDASQRLRSAAPLVAGAIARSVEEKGVWRSVAGQPLSFTHQSYPSLRPQQRLDLEEQFDISVLHLRNAGLALEDERVLAGVFSDSSEHAKSAEISRFLGWLRRELEKWGNDLLFEVDPNDPRPEIALRYFFSRLHRSGALRGRLPEDAFSIRPIRSQENALVFEIEIAPAFPIDRIVINLSSDALEVKDA